jgi:hypothetical protein
MTELHAIVTHDGKFGHRSMSSIQYEGQEEILHLVEKYCHIINPTNDFFLEKTSHFFYSLFFKQCP